MNSTRFLKLPCIGQEVRLTIKLAGLKKAHAPLLH